VMVLGLVVAPAAAQQIDPATGDVSDLDAVVDAYNQRSDAVPTVIADVVGDERVNINITGNRSSAVYGVVLDGMNVTRYEAGGLDDPTLDVYTTTDTVVAIAEADDPRDRAADAFTSDEIRYEPRGGIMQQIKYTVVSMLVRVQNLF